MSDPIEELLRPASGASEVGPNLEYEPEFAELLRKCEGSHPQQMGESVLPGEPAQPEAARQMVESMLGRSKDLRLAVHWQLLVHRLEGPRGYLRGLRLIRGLLDRYGPTLHPTVDADDPAHLVRANALAAALVPSVLRRLEAELKASDAGELAKLVETALDDLAALRRAFARDGGGEHSPGPDFEPLQRLLRPLRVVSKDSHTGQERSAELGKPEPSAASPRAAVSSRAEVTCRLEEIREYYARCEPGSPVPLLLARAQKLVGASFYEAVLELLPTAVDQLGPLTGNPRH